MIALDFRSSNRIALGCNDADRPASWYRRQAPHLQASSYRIFAMLKKRPGKTAKARSAKFEREVERQIEAGKLNPTEAAAKFHRVLRAATKHDSKNGK